MYRRCISSIALLTDWNVQTQPDRTNLPPPDRPPEVAHDERPPRTTHHVSTPLAPFYRLAIPDVDVAMSFMHYITARTGLMVVSPPPAAPDPPPAWEEDVLESEDETEQENTIIEAKEPQWPEPVAMAAYADRHCDDRNARKARQRTLRGAPANGLALRQYAEATLGGGSLRKAVKLPEGEDEDEWLAVNSESLRIARVPRCSMLTDCSGRLLQPDQPPLRCYHRVLLARHVLPDEGDRRVRVPLARQRKLQEADQDVRARIHQPPHDVGAEHDRQREYPAQPHRCAPSPYALPSSVA